MTFYNKSRTRYSAIFFLTIILTQLTIPTVTYAISSGPNQMEYTGFSSGDTSELVDLATGDFMYNIPLMTIPGPGGGYPLQLAYNSGSGINDEASWVGLGWSLNPGVINRQMRGIPDDFSGENPQDKITKTNYIKNNRTVGLSVSSDLMSLLPEVFGADMSMIAPSFSVPASYAIYSNTYSGLGTRIGIGAGISALNNEMSSINATASFNLTMDSNEGAEVQGSLTASAIFAKYNLGYTADARNGITSVTKSSTYGLPGLSKPFYKAGGTYATSSHIPEVMIPMKGANVSLSVDMEAGGAGVHSNIPLTIEGSYSNMWVADAERTFLGYGYFNSHKRSADESTENILMDYNRENDVPVNMKLPSLPMPVATADIYTVKGVGGGSIFRGFRNDAGIYYTPAGYSRSGGASIGFEAAAATGFKIAADISGFYASSYSGKWRDGYGNLYNKLDFKTPPALSSGNASAAQAFYFRELGEPTPLSNLSLYNAFDKSDPSFIGIHNTNAIDEQLSPEDMPDYDGDYPFSGMQKFKTGILNQMNGKPIPNYLKTFREKQNVLQMYRTAKEIKDGGNEFFKAANVATSTNPLDRTFSIFDFSLPTNQHIANTHIGEFSILQSDGSTFHYGIPTYNRVQEETIFSFVNSSSSSHSDLTSSPIVTYNPSMYTYSSNASRDEYVSINKISPYSNAHLLTNITSYDYVDIDNNGPSENDFGSYTKINYKQFFTNFKWRIPFTTTNNTAVQYKGFTSHDYDNKATFSYGEKEIWYTQSIETKTHIAVFYVSDRLDGVQALNKHGGRDLAAGKLQKLDKIVLYSKKELATNPTNPEALQTIEFGYSYDLCPNVPTNTGVTGGIHPNTLIGGDANAKQGKLTLVKLTIKNGVSNKGVLTPYIFDYGDRDDINNNPAYSFESTDRWGAYRPDGETINGLAVKNDINSYTRQDQNHKNILDQRAGAWNIKKIYSPSGGTITIDYETDDYGYVQDKAATQMVQIVGTSYEDGSHKELSADGKTKFPISQEYRKIYFKPETPLSGSTSEKETQVLKYIENFNNNKIYFKLYEFLRKPKGENNWASDYVTGYTEIKTITGSYGFIQHASGDIPFFTIKNVDQKGKHPFRVAGLQYMRYTRSDLARTAPGSAANTAGIILGALPALVSSLELIFGFYKWSIMNGHCEYIDASSPSFVKLHSPDGIKYGGGHRVKKISIKDGWDILTGNQAGATYEQNYVYTIQEGRDIGKSSGVAAYEPQIGGEENALKEPMFYDPDNKYIHNDKAFFIETPIAESYYPAPLVVYSQITTYSTATEDVKASGAGITIYNNYTAKDYPTISHTHQPYFEEDNQTTFIPFIAGIQFRNLGYSQGYSVEINDMHGKLKSIYTYDSDQWNKENKRIIDANTFTSYKKYIYNQSDGSPQWNEDFETLNEDAPYTHSEKLGLDFEMFSEINESSEFSFSGGAQINAGVDVAPWVIFIAALPYFEYAETGVRTIVTNKVIYRTAILTEEISYSEGNIEKTKHIAFNSETGTPILTLRTSDYDSQTNGNYLNPDYLYALPGQWFYKTMSGGYTNYRVDARVTMASGNTNIADANKYINPGDEIYCSSCPSGSKKLWVNSINNNIVNITTKNGTPVNGTYDISIFRSGNRNLLSWATGEIISTKSPNGPGLNPVLQYFNDHASTMTGAISFGSSNPNYPAIHDCYDYDKIYTGRIDLLYSNGYFLRFILNQCDKEILIPVDATNYSQLSNYRVYAGATDDVVYIQNSALNSGQPQLVTLQGSTFGDCGINECMEGVLHAAASEYYNEYNYDASDLAAPVGYSPYPSGSKGIYRRVRSNAYFASRTQSKDATNSSTYVYPTYTGEDGVYEKFVKFDFNKPNNNNIQNNVGWRWTTQIPDKGYSRDGLILEIIKPLSPQNILTSNLYGYSRGLINATADNASQREIGFDSFEEHPTGTYVISNAPGRLLFSNTANQTLNIVDNVSHTGKNSLLLTKTGGSTIGVNISMNIPVYSTNVDHTQSNKMIQLVANKKYVISFWAKDNVIINNVSVVTINGSFANVDAGIAVDGWRRIECIFTAPSAGIVPITIGAFNNTLYIDDIRICPYNAAMKTVVYDNRKFLPVAELDIENYATYYIYDEENKVVITKKETEKGIHTISNNRSNIKK